MRSLGPAVRNHDCLFAAIDGRNSPSCSLQRITKFCNLGTHLILLGKPSSNRTLDQDRNNHTTNSTSETKDSSEGSQGEMESLAVKIARLKE